MNTGYLELIVGPMFSGKTSELISLYRNYVLSNKNVCVINYIEDKRYTQNKLTSHDKISIDCMFLKDLHTIYNNEYDIILLNEGQFFKDIYQCVTKWIDVDKKKVHIAALDGDFNRKSFQNIVDLIPLCDKITKRHAICIECGDGAPAIFTYKYKSSTRDIIDIGGSDKYKSVCRNCYLEKYFTN